MNQRRRVNLQMNSLTRFGFSSLVATAVDAAVYQLMVFGAAHAYVRAACVAAACGAIVGFSLSRHWVFRIAAADPSSQRFAFGIGPQILLYGLTSALGAATVSATLWLLVEVLGSDARLAWFPAKLLAWGAISFPLQKGLVFRGAS